MRRWRDDRFVRPSAADPRRLSRLEADLWEQVPPLFEGIELSPVTPLGTSSAIARVSQDRVVSTARGSEVVSDSTTVLALEAAARRRTGGHPDGVHLASCGRQLRAQDFGAGRSAHFRLLTLLSSGPRQGSGLQESTMLAHHVRCWVTALGSVAPGLRVRIEVTAWNPVLRERLVDTVLPEFAGHPTVEVVEDPDRVRAKGYYSDGAILVLGQTSAGPVELGDGGFTDWTAQLTANGKEVCFTSCVATERLALAVDGGPWA
jgi:hypothetical protein